MDVINEMDKKVAITYPCEWKYKVIGPDKEKVQQAVQSVFGERPHQCRFSNSSKKGNYHSYEVSTLVHNEDDRTQLYAQLKGHDDLTMVL